jgi:hypothetical protein
MRIKDAKVGAKVSIVVAAKHGPRWDDGVIVKRPKNMGTVITGTGPNDVWVKWSNGDVLWASVDDLTLVKAAPEPKNKPPKNTAEQDAVMLLLSLGYTITKG